MKKDVILVLTVGGVLAFFLQREQERGTFVTVDSKHVQWLQSMEGRGVPPPRASVIFGTLTDPDLPEGERQFTAWPPSNLEWAGLLHHLASYQPRTVVVESAGNWPQPTSDAALAKSCGGLPSLLLGYRAEALGDRVEAKLGEIPQVVGDRTLIPNFQVGIASAGLEVMGKVGISQVDISESDLSKPSLRPGGWRVPLLFRQDQRVVPSLLLLTLIQDRKIALADTRVELGKSIVLPDGWQIPIDASGGYLVHDLPVNSLPLPKVNMDNFKMPWEKLHRFLSAKHPLREQLPDLKNSIFWIGDDDQAARRFTLTSGEKASTAELSCRALIAMQTGRNVKPLGKSGQVAILVGAQVFAVILGSLRRSNVFKLGVLSLLLPIPISLWAFVSARVWMPLSALTLVLATIFLLILLIARSDKSV